MPRSLNDIRAAFLDFFASHDHRVLPSSPLVPQNDPTLMFTAAGMVPFKHVFSGLEPAPYPRAATAQKCVRAGGKHNDLDNVGYTARHHTFFEMLGNFSFGDYFKEQAIRLAWELVTKEYGIPAEKLGVTVYHTDNEAFELWRKIAGLPESKILRVPTSDNFWSAGDTGPCGPCTEIFYDHGTGEGVWALDGSGRDRFGERFVEIWNLVFMQFETHEDGNRTDLPKPSIDTGMGLERITAVLQGVHDNYDIDLFRALIAASQELFPPSIPPASGGNARGGSMVSHRVIADHLRASSFLIADGVLPSNEGRGYVLRRIMRRAMRHAHLLGAGDPLMWKLVPALIEQMGASYPELIRAQAAIQENLRAEEERFQQTLGRGLKLLEEESAHLSKGATLSGEAAFKLYDTYGFPLDLTQDILRSRGIDVDTESFDAAMERQKSMSAAAWAGSGDKGAQALWFGLKERIGATRFEGYDADEAEATILAIVKNGEPVEHAAAGDSVSLILDRTPFYGESGGQVGDSGLLYGADGKTLLADITDTAKPLEDFIVHHAVLKAPVKTGDRALARIDVQRRTRIRANHSATHLLHKALREVLGEHVTQKGSLVAPDRLRFDFSHGKSVSAEDIERIERKVNRLIWRNTPISIEEMHPDEATKKGAMALFGEKYGEKVRVLSMGLSDDGEKPASSHYSIELCGGTHVRATGDIGLFKILSESAVAAGIRRIEALTREDAYDYLRAKEEALNGIAGSFKVASGDVQGRVAKLAADHKRLEKELADAKRQLAVGGAGGMAEAGVETIGAYRFTGRIFQGLEPKELRGIAEQFLRQGADVAAALTVVEGKASIVVAVHQDKTGKLSAVPLVQQAVAVLGGKGGGGRPEMAQGGGPEADKVQETMESLKQILAQGTALHG